MIKRITFFVVLLSAAIAVASNAPKAGLGAPTEPCYPTYGLGDSYVQTDATPGMNIWICASNAASGSWIQQSGSGGGSGTVNSGTATHLGGYTSTGTVISDLGDDFTFLTHTMTGGASSIFDLHSAATSGLLLPGALGTGFLKVTTSTGAVSSVATVPLNSLSTQAADTVVINATGGSAAPTAVSLASLGGTNSCGGSANALTYNSSTHAWGCNTISGSGTVNTGTQYYAGAYASATAVIGPVAPIQYSGELFGMVAGAADNTAALNTALTILSTIGIGNKLKLPIGGPTNITSGVVLPKASIIVGSGVPLWNNGPLALPSSYLNISFNSSPLPSIQCLAPGTCGLENLLVVNSANGSPFMLYTCGVPYLNNVGFLGDTSVIGGTPTNDGIWFGQSGVTGATCNSTGAGTGFSGYGSNYVNNLYFQNIKTALSFFDNANGINVRGIRGDYTDGNTSGCFVRFNGVVNETYGNSIRDMNIEGANFSTGVPNYLGAVCLDSKANINDIEYEISDIGNAAATGHSAYICNGCTRNRLVTPGGLYTLGAFLDSNPTLGGNELHDMSNLIMSIQNYQGISLGLLGSNKSGFDNIRMNSAGKIGWMNGSGSTFLTCLTRVALGEVALGNCSVGDKSGIFDVSTVALTNATPTVGGQIGFDTTSNRIVSGNGATTDTYVTTSDIPLVVSFPPVVYTASATPGLLGSAVVVVSSPAVNTCYAFDIWLTETTAGNSCTTGTGTIAVDWTFKDGYNGISYPSGTPWKSNLLTGNGAAGATLQFHTPITRTDTATSHSFFNAASGTQVTYQLEQIAGTASCSVQPTYTLKVNQTSATPCP